MKFSRPLFIMAALVAPSFALETAAVSAVTAKFESPSHDEQYQARIELNRLIDEATIPGKGDAAAVTRTLCAVLQDAGTSQEAKKYLLRALSRVATEDAVDAVVPLLEGSDDLLREEARQTLRCIPGAKAVAALENALRKATAKRDKIALAGSLAFQKSATSAPLLAGLAADADPETARAGIRSLSAIGGDAAVAALKKILDDGALPDALKPDVEKALLVASAGESKTASAIFQSTRSDSARLAAFIALTGGQPESAPVALIEQAVKSEHADVRHEALKRAIEMNLTSVVSGLAAAMTGMPIEDRRVVVGSIRHLKSVETAGKIALAVVNSEDPNERVAAITALGGIPTQAAFDAALQSLSARNPAVNQAAASAVAINAYPQADATLLSMLKGAPGEAQVLAIKAAAVRQLPGANEILIQILSAGDEASAREATRTLYFSASIDDLRKLCETAAATQDEVRRKSLVSTCTRIAGRIGGEEAKALLKPLE